MKRFPEVSKDLTLIVAVGRTARTMVSFGMNKVSLYIVPLTQDESVLERSRIQCSVEKIADRLNLADRTKDAAVVV